jgi:hypothetical protein
MVTEIIEDDEYEIVVTENIPAELTRKRLAEGECFLQYKKLDGTLRTTTGTTNNELIPEESQAGTMRKPNGPQDLISYYDTASQGWRSFYPYTLERVFIIP